MKEWVLSRGKARPKITPLLVPAFYTNPSVLVWWSRILARIITYNVHGTANQVLVNTQDSTPQYHNTKNPENDPKWPIVVVGGCLQILVNGLGNKALCKPAFNWAFLSFWHGHESSFWIHFQLICQELVPERSFHGLTSPFICLMSYTPDTIGHHCKVSSKSSVQIMARCIQMNDWGQMAQHSSIFYFQDL